MQSPPIQQRQHHQETTTRTTPTTTTAITTTDNCITNSSEAGSSDRRTTISSGKEGSSGTLLNPKEIEAAKVVEEEEEENSTTSGRGRNIINEEVTSTTNDNKSSSSSRGSGSGSSSSNSSAQVGQQRELSRSIPNSSSQIAEISLEHALGRVPRALVGVVVVEVDNNKRTGRAAAVANLTASSSNSRHRASNQDQSIATSSQAKQGSNELPFSLPCNSTITNPNRHQLDQSVSLKRSDPKIKVTLSAPRSLSDHQQIEHNLSDSTTTIPASVSSSTLSSNLVANNSNNNIKKRRQSTATLISASGCGEAANFSSTDICDQIESNSSQQQEQQLNQIEEIEVPQHVVSYQHHHIKQQPLQQPQANLKEQVEAGLRRIASQRISRNPNNTLQTAYSKQQQPIQVKVERPSQDFNLAEPKQELIKPALLVSQQRQQQQQQQQQQSTNHQHLQANQNNLSINQNNSKQLAIYINGKIRSNSIFCQSSSANSFSSILNRFHGGGSNTNSTTSAPNSATQAGKLEQSPQQQQQRLLTQIDCGAGEFVGGATNHQIKKRQSLCQRIKQNYFKWNGNRVNTNQLEQTISDRQHKQSGRGRKKVFNLSSSAKRFLNNHFSNGNDDESISLTNQTARDSNVSQKAPLCQSNLPTSAIATPLIRKNSQNTTTTTTNQTKKELPQIVAETKVIIESDPSENSIEQQQQQTTKTSYKLNPSSMFLRKAMRYYRLWIYCTNITILLGTLIFILSTIYVMSDYRFRLLVSQSPVRRSMQLAEDNHDQIVTTNNLNENQQQQQQHRTDEASNNSLPTSGNFKAPLYETFSPSNDSSKSGSFSNSNSGRISNSGPSEKDFDIHIKYSEPSVIIAYAVIAIQAGVLQAIGCFGAIRMKERWIQAFWYMILGLTVFDVVFLLYWLNRYDFIVNSLQQHMKFRLKEHYGGFQQFESSSYSILTGDYFNLAPNPHPSMIDTLLDNSINSTTSSRSLPQSSSLAVSSFTRKSSIVPTNELYSQMDKILTEIIDKIQTDSQCCGISNSLDYKRSKWRQIKLDQLRVRLNWTEEGRDEASGIQNGGLMTTMDKRITDLNVAANLLRRVPLVPASCCKPIRRANKEVSGAGAKTTNRRDNRPVILDDSQLDWPPRVPAWSPSMVIENLQESTANVRRKSKLAAAAAMKATKEEVDTNNDIDDDPNDDDDHEDEATDDDEGDSVEQEGKSERGSDEINWREHKDGIRNKGKYYLEDDIRDETNGLPPNDDLSLVEMLDRRWSVQDDLESKGLGQQKSRLPILGPQTTDDDDDFYDNLNNHQRRLISKQENFNYPHSVASSDETNNVMSYNAEDYGDGDDERNSFRAKQRKRRWLVESRVDESEQVLSRFIEDLKESMNNRDDTMPGEEQIDGSSKLGQLRALRHLLFSCNLTRNGAALSSIHDYEATLDNQDESCSYNYTSEDNFRWPNKLQLSFDQYKLLESYLLLGDNLTSSAGHISSDVGFGNENVGETELDSFTNDNYRSNGEMATNESGTKYDGPSNGQIDNETATLVSDRRSFDSNGREMKNRKRRRRRINEKQIRRGKSKRNAFIEQSSKQLPDGKASSSLDESKRRRLELAEAIRSDPDTTCAPRSYFDQATIYTHGCQPVIKSWLDSSAHILFVTGFCVLTVLKFCSVVLLRLEIQEMIHKIRVLKGMATEYNALHDLEAYLPRPSICAQAAELTPSGVTAALAASPTTNQSSSCCIGGAASIPCNSSIVQQQQQQQQLPQTQSQQQPPVVAPPRLGGSFSEAVVAAATAAAASQQQQQQHASISNQPSINLFGQLGFGLGPSGLGSGTVGRATSMKAMTVGMSNMLTPDLCPRSSSASSAHLQATTFLASQKHALSLRSELFQSPSSVMSRRHTAVSVCPAAAAAAAAAAHHLMSRRGTYVANPVFNAAPLINSGLNLNQHRHSAHTLGCSSSLLKPPLRQQFSGPKSSQACHCLLGSGDSAQINDNSTPSSGVNYSSNNNNNQAVTQSEHHCGIESNIQQQQQQHSGGQSNTSHTTHQQHRQQSNRNRGSQQLLSLVYPFKRQSSAQSACNFPLDLSPPMITESRRSIH